MSKIEHLSMSEGRLHLLCALSVLAPFFVNLKLSILLSVLGLLKTLRQSCQLQITFPTVPFGLDHDVFFVKT